MGKSLKHATHDAKPPPPAIPQVSLIKPRWNKATRTLSFDGKLVKRFRGRLGNQEYLLRDWQERRWPRVIVDPLPRGGGVDLKRRLHDTIKRLNRNQVHRLIHFSGTGTGTAVRWDPVS